jgi:hypothetical protein
MRHRAKTFVAQLPASVAPCGHDQNRRNRDAALAAAVAYLRLTVQAGRISPFGDIGGIVDQLDLDNVS